MNKPHEYFMKYLPSSKGSVIWDKNNGTTFFADYELIFVSNATTNRKFVYPIATMRPAENRIHKTQKPIALYKWLLKHYAKPGQTIIDTHVGSGSIRVACHDMGFDFEGCEIDPDYWQNQEKRYENHKKNKEGYFQKNIFTGDYL